MRKRFIVQDLQVAVCVCDDGSNNKGEICILRIGNGAEMTVVRTIPQTFGCLGIAYHKGRLYVASETGLRFCPYDSERENMTLLNNSPATRVAVAADGERIYIISKNKLITLNSSDDHLPSVGSPELESPVGLAVANYNSVFVCGGKEDKYIVRLDKDGGRKIATLIRNSNDGVRMLESMYFNTSTHTIVIGQENDNLKVLSLDSDGPNN